MTEIYSCNKDKNTLYLIVTFPSYILPKGAKTSEPRGQALCIAVHLYKLEYV